MKKAGNTPKQGNTLFNYFQKSPRVPTTPSSSHDGGGDGHGSGKKNGKSPDKHSKSPIKTPTRPSSRSLASTSTTPTSQALTQEEYECAYVLYDLVWAKLEG